MAGGEVKKYYGAGGFGRAVPRETGARGERRFATRRTAWREVRAGRGGGGARKYYLWGSDPLLPCTFSAPSLHLLCTFSAPSLHLLSTFSPPSLHLLCTFSAGLPDFPGWTAGSGNGLCRSGDFPGGAWRTWDGRKRRGAVDDKRGLGRGLPLVTTRKLSKELLFDRPRLPEVALQRSTRPAHNGGVKFGKVGRSSRWIGSRSLHENNGGIRGADTPRWIVLFRARGELDGLALAAGKRPRVGSD